MYEDVLCVIQGIALARGTPCQEEGEEEVMAPGELDHDGEHTNENF